MEALYKAGEESRLPIKVSDLNLPTLPSEEELDSLIAREMIITEDGAVNLTSTGMAFAEQIVRRHRLAERLFSEILELKDSALNSTSCSFEHVLDPSVTESVCTILGHPPSCPHGKRIPPGECCKVSRSQVAPIVTPLHELPVGQEAKIVFITTPHHQRLSRLVNLGVVPGGKFILHQKKPSYLLKLGLTEIAIDDSIAREIYVRKI